MSAPRMTTRRWIGLSLICFSALCIQLGFAPIERASQEDHPRLQPYPDESELIHGTVTRILDENTLLIRIGDKNERYDLLGVASFRRSESANARVAMDALSRLLLHEQVAIHHDPKGRRNASSRLVGYIYRQPDKLLSNLELIRQGYARHSSGWMSRHKDVFSHFATKAEALERGVWGDQVQVLNLDEPKLIEDAVPDQSLQSPQSPIYITKHGKKFHREGCPHLTESAKPTTREEIDGTHEPCKTCKPDET